MTDDLHMKLLYLENRVAFARLFFPAEAKVAMDIAHTDIASELSDHLREADLNEMPNNRLLSRLEELMKSVEKGRKYFPSCSKVIEKFMEDDLPDLFYLEKGTPDEESIKRTLFMELKEDVGKAFSKDKAALGCLPPNPH